MANIYAYARKLPILKRLIPSIKKRLASVRYTNGLMLKRFGNAVFLLNYNNYVDREIAFYNDFEQAQLKFFFDKMKNHGCDVFFDIGANFGYYTVLAGLQPQVGQVFSFEPDPRNYVQLTSNIFINDLFHKVHAHVEAVSDQKGQCQLNLFPQTSTGQSHIGDQGDNTITVPTVTIDDFMHFTDQKIFMKIDIEGHELSALRGAVRTLQENKCFIQVESFAAQQPLVKDFLTALGYRAIHVIDSDFYFENF